MVYTGYFPKVNQSALLYMPRIPDWIVAGIAMTRIPPTATILNVKVHALTNDRTLALIEEFIADGQPHQLVTVNPEFVVAAQHDDDRAQDDAEARGARLHAR